MEIDIPNIWQYFGELIGPVVQDGSVPLEILRPVAEPLKDINKAGELIAEVLYDISHREVYISFDFYAFNISFLFFVLKI